MEFKPTKLKVIFSIIIALIIEVFVSIASSYDNFLAILPIFLINFFTLHDFSKIFGLNNLLLFIILLIIIYLIFSLFQKKEDNKTSTTPKPAPVSSINQPPAVLPPANQPAANTFNLTLPDINPNLSN